MRPAFTIGGAELPVVMTAVHAGHDVRPEVAAFLQLDEATRRREEDPYTDRVARAGGARFVVHRSRFEVDLNRPESQAVYRGAAWGLDVWREAPPPGVVERSLAIHADFYRALAARLDDLAASGPFVVLDLHSYNHRRGGPDAPPDDEHDNPEVNVGTAGVEPHRWARLVERFMADLAAERVAGHPLDVRANVRFQGGHLVRWIHDRYPTRGCALAIELRKSFMDEWTGSLDAEHLRQLTTALGATLPGLVDELAGVRVR
jgi:N-formylglutamate amidohydrolase